ncbi:MAG: ABC transporter permease [Defluviitaleaceae bacterium]|nr:ABC transporter permease [Defluviitaleaceae bacterium]
MKSTKLAIPYIIWIFIFTIVPVFLLINYAFSTNTGSFTIDNFSRFFSPLYIGILMRSFYMAFWSTIICFIIAYPVAYILSTKEFKNRNVLILLFIVPMWMNFLVRTYAWLFILGNNGVLNIFLGFLGFPQIRLLFTDAAVLIGLVYTFLPFMIFPIYSSLSKIDYKIVEGAQDLGANSFYVMLKIIFPLSLPGIASGLTMVFMPAVATFLVSNILGGGGYMLIGNLIEQQFMIVGNRHFGSAISLILLALILVFNMLISTLIREEETN